MLETLKTFRAAHAGVSFVALGQAVLCLALVLAASPGGAAPSAADRALIGAAKRGDVSGVRQALARGADVNAETKEGWTALMAAALSADRVAVVRLLLARGADARARNGRGLTALMYASGAGSAPVARLLLTHGADVAVQDTGDGTTALMFAASAPVTRLLLAWGAPAKTRDRTGRAALDYMVVPDNVASARLLLEHGAWADAAGSETTPLMAASSRRMMRLLLAHGAKLETRNKEGFTALLGSAQNDEAAKVRFLLAHGARISAARAGQTALYYAVERGRVDAARVLLEHGAPVNTADRYGSTPLRHAIETDNVEAVHLLLEHGAQVSTKPDAKPLLLSSLSMPDDGPETTRLLLKCGANVNQADKAGRTPLMLAAEQGRAAMAEMLLRSGASVNAQDSEGRTALMRAAGADNRLALLKVLLSHGAKLDAADRKGRTALMSIASTSGADGGASESAEFLLGKGASITKKDTLGLSALTLFQQNAAGNPGFAALLRRRRLPVTPAWEPRAFL